MDLHPCFGLKTLKVLIKKHSSSEDICCSYKLHVSLIRELQHEEGIKNIGAHQTNKSVKSHGKGKYRRMNITKIGLKGEKQRYH